MNQNVISGKIINMKLKKKVLQKLVVYFPAVTISVSDKTSREILLLCVSTEVNKENNTIWGAAVLILPMERIFNCTVEMALGDVI
jgi:type IV secretory pathway VirB3-like protein